MYALTVGFIGRKIKMQKITFQGAPGAYSHIACKELFPGADYVASDTFEQAMELVDNGEADFAVIPVENSSVTEGYVTYLSLIHI